MLVDVKLGLTATDLMLRGVMGVVFSSYHECEEGRILRRSVTLQQELCALLTTGPLRTQECHQPCQSGIRSIRAVAITMPRERHTQHKRESANESFLSQRWHGMVDMRAGRWLALQRTQRAVSAA